MTDEQLSPLRTEKQFGGAAQYPSNRTINLTREQAAKWLMLTSQLVSRDTSDSPGIEQFRDVIENSCWLARWKREDVVIDVCPSLLADVLPELVATAATDLIDDNAAILEEIVQILSTN